MARRILLIDIGSGLVVTGVLPSVALFADYAAKLTASGGLPPYAFDLVAGALPDGIAVDSATGAFSGTADDAGIYKFTVRVTDLAGTYVDHMGQITVIAEPLTLSGAAPDGTVGVEATYTYTVAGGVPPYTYTLVSPPAGWSIEDPADPTVTMAPAAEGTYTWRIRVIDAEGTTFDLDDSAEFSEPVVLGDTWNPSDKGPNVVLSNGNLTMVRTGEGYVNMQLTRSTRSHNAGRYYFELTCNRDGNNNSQYGAGLVIATTPTTTSSAVPGSLGIRPSHSTLHAAWNNDLPGASPSGTLAFSPAVNFASGVVVGYAVDFDAGKIWVRINGQWIGGATIGVSADPTAGTNPSFSFTPGTTLFIMGASPYQNTQITMNVGLTDFRDTKPVGFGFW